MLPGTQGLSTVALTGAFLPPDITRPKLTVKPAAEPGATCVDAYPADWEMGGIGLNDPSQGLVVQPWKFWADGSDVKVGPDPGGPWTTLFSVSGITELSGAFDVSMAPAVAYVVGGATYLWWYSPLLGAYTTTMFAGCSSPRLALDDKRASQSGNADIVFAYIRAEGLYYRLWRDRYATERFLCAQPANTLRLGRVGMSTRNRMQFEFLLSG